MRFAYRRLWDSLGRTFLLALSSAICTGAQAQSETPLSAASRALQSIDIAVGEGRGLEGNPRIVGGTEAREGQWPSMVVLFRKTGDTRAEQGCGGSVIDRRWVVSAAHCFGETESDPRRIATSYFAVENTVDLQRGGRRLAVSRIIVHPDYTRDPNGPSDVALLELTDDAHSPRQALAAGPRASAFLQPAAIATAVGFGGTKAVSVNEISSPNYAALQQFSTRLLQVDVPIVAPEKCKGTYPKLHADGQFCAGYDEGGKDSCQGDSGGPIYMHDKVRRFVQIGIVSYGKGCAQPNAWGVYTYVGYFRDWIRGYVPNAVFEGDAPAAQPGPVVAGAGSPALQQIVVQQPPAPPSQFAQVTVEVLPGNVVRFDQLIRIRVTSSIAGRLLVFNREENGQAVLVFPSRASRAAQAGRQLETIKAGETIVLPSAGSGFQLRAGPPAGENNVIAVVLPEGARTADIAERYGNLSPIADLDRVFVDLAQQTKDIRVDDGKSDRAVGQRSYRIVP